MELTLVVLLLWLFQQAMHTQFDALGSAALYGSLFAGLLQLMALRHFRADLPVVARDSLTHIPPLRLSLGWIVFCVLALALLQVMAFLHLPTSVEVAREYRPYAAHWVGWLTICLVLPLVEEIVFRACAMGLLLRRMSKTPAVALAAAAFACVHLSDPVHACVAFVGGLVLGFAYLQTRSVLPGYIAHAINNAVALGVLGLHAQEQKLPAMLVGA
ncbi:CPBP family intramembrane glutamic endopeptidase [uncultured Methylibium sp.]|uniref:CPBP family intramembrane glutamic endopeptidase n=1 Tax=uncultured Methylibium sp. TaxID=381093 RepID=UPI0025F9A15C|nr:CPBP family intramembrane glutamic endopeptidase [uncultured Methylibium sp.]